MRRRKFLLGSSAALASSSFLTGTGAFSSTEFDRNVTVEVVADEDAYLGLSEEETTDGDGKILFGEQSPRTEPASFDIINQSTTEISVTVTLEDETLEFVDGSPTADSGPVTVDDHSLAVTDLKTGEAIQNVTIKIPTDELGSGPVTDRISFSVTGPDFGIEAERTLSLLPLVESVQFNGQGSVEFTTNADDPFELVYWVAERTEPDSNDGNGESTDNSRGEGERSGNQGRPPGTITEYGEMFDPSFGPSEDLNGSDGGPGYLAVYLPAVDRSYRRRQFHPDTDRIDGWGSREGVVEDGKLEPEA